MQRVVVVIAFIVVSDPGSDGLTSAASAVALLAVAFLARRLVRPWKACPRQT